MGIPFWLILLQYFIENFTRIFSFGLFVYLTSLLVLKLLYGLFCAAKKHPFSFSVDGIRLLSLLLLLPVESVSFQESFSMFFITSCLSIACVILRESIHHGGFLIFMRHTVIEFFHWVKTTKYVILKAKVNPLLEKFGFLSFLLLIAYTCICFFNSPKAVIDGTEKILLLFCSIFIGFSFLGDCLVSARKLFILWFSAGIVCCALIVTNPFDSTTKTAGAWLLNCFFLTIFLSIIWGFIALLADAPCCHIVLSFCNFLITCITIIANIFLLVFIPYWEGFSEMFPDLHSQIHDVSVEITLLFNIIFIPMLIATNIAAFLKELQGYAEYLEQKTSQP